MATSTRLRFLPLVLGATLLALSFPLAGNTDGAAGGCILTTLERHALHEFIETPSQKKLDIVRNNLCRYIDAAEYHERPRRRELAAQTLAVVVAFHGICSPKFSDKLRRDKPPPSIQRVFEEFCRKFVNTMAVISSDFEGESEASLTAKLEHMQPLAEHYRWLRKEMFCQVSGLQASPGSWQGMLTPDLPAIQRLEKLADSLCDDVRKDAITVDEAQYRWSQEWARVERRVGPEAAREGLRSLWEILSALVK